ncbi:MAG: NUDIX domain-containing protein [Ignavibacteriaceae bacterium]|nr:NUDIX domain-containing protein [Ignavibacteriaceae bacterium]
MVTSAGLLMYRFIGSELEYFLVHPGGPIFTNKDEGYWGIPKGILDDGEDLLIAAKREFEEETGIKPNHESFIFLGSVIQRNNKEVYAWAFEGLPGELPEIVSNLFEMEWPYKSGKRKSFPEIDRGKYFNRVEALQKIYIAQADFIYRLNEKLKVN